MRPVLQFFYDRSCCLRAFIERISNEININVLKKRSGRNEENTFINDFKMADLNLFCFVLFFLVSFFSSFLHRMIVVKY